MTEDTDQKAGGSGRRLESWKEIAGYLRTSVRTVQRWEAQNGLPVHRVMREKRAAIYAETAELDEWLASRTVVPQKAEAPEASGKGSRRAYLVAVVLVVAVLGGVSWVRLRPQPEAVVFAQRLTGAPGFEVQAVKSPDGKWLAYATYLKGSSSILVEGTKSGEKVEVARGTATMYSPQWSRDGNWLLYLRRKSDAVSELMRYHWGQRGDPDVVAEVSGQGWFDTGVHSYPAVQWTPDGLGALVLERDAETRAYRLVRLDLGTRERRTALAAPAGTSLHGFALSWDGGELAVVVRQKNIFRLHTVGMDREMKATGELRPVWDESLSTEAPAWLGNGDLFFIRGQKELWRRTKGGSVQPVRITGPWPDYSVSGTVGGELVWSHTQMDTAIWLYDLELKKTVRPMCDSTTLERQARVSPDGKELAFNSERDGWLNVWACDVETGEKVRQVTKVKDGNVWGIQWAPDGKRIAVAVSFRDRSEIWVVAADGTATSTVAAGPGQRGTPVWNRDGSRVYFVLRGGSGAKIQSARVDGSDLRTEGAPGAFQEMFLRADGKYWLLMGEQLVLSDAAGKEKAVKAEKVSSLGGLTSDGLGISFNKRTNPGMTGNYTFWVMDAEGRERMIAPAVVEGMGYADGPPGFAFFVRNSDASADLFRGRWAQ